MSSLVVPPWAWALLGVLLVVCIAIDLLAHRGDHVDSRRAAVVWSVIWIGVSLAFGVFVAVHFGASAAEQFIAAYLLEKSLSVDNLFLFLVVFGALGIPAADQRRVLTWGIIGALATRMGFIFAGVAVLQRWHEVTYVFGALLVLTSLKLLRPSRDDGGEPRLLGWLERHLPWTRRLDGHRFFTREQGRLVATPLFIALVAIESADVVFSLDSIPAAFAVSEDTFILYSANVFAVLGLRALYVVLARLLAGLRYLHIGLAAVLAFAGVKMLIAHAYKFPPLLSVLVIVVCIAAAVIASLVATARKERDLRLAAQEPREGTTETG